MTMSLPGDVPAWVPDSVQTYLSHVVDGRSIRSIARSAGLHASTVMRQVHRCEQRRDDPLIDTALSRLSRARATGAEHMTDLRKIDEGTPLDMAAEPLRALRRLAEPGACLAVAPGMETAVIVRQGVDGQTVRLGSVASSTAEFLALKDWIAGGPGGRVVRYRITGEGRAALRAADETGEDPAGRTRQTSPETPLSMLARRRDKDGGMFLTAPMVRAGERLREEYELACAGPVPEGGWESLLIDRETGDPAERGPAGARARLSAALCDLGPGLGDVVLRVCCRLEGLETVEKRMGWAARSGKIVLRIGLDRLARHFDAHGGPGGGLIG